MTTCLLALLLPLAPDVVNTRQKKTIEGRILDFPQHVEVTQADGKKVVIPRQDIAWIEIAPNLIECPEIIPFPADQIDKAVYDFISFENTLVGLPRPPDRKIVAVEILPKIRKAWELDLPGRIGDVLVCGRTLYLLQREESVDDTRKIKVAGAPFSRKVHKITVTAVDFVSGQTAFKFAVDNSEGKKELWEFAPGAPVLLASPDRALLRVVKTGWPMDAKGNVDKAQTRTAASLYTWDVKTKRLSENSESGLTSDPKARLFLHEDQLVTLTPTGSLQFALQSTGLPDGKSRWKTEDIGGRFYDIVGDQAYVMDNTHLYAWSLKTGKKVEKWAIQHSDGLIEAVDYDYVYHYRRRQEPRAIVGYDVRKAEKAFEIPIPERDDFRHEKLVGHRLIYTDRAQTLRAFDTLQKKLLWEWKGSGTGVMANLSLVGSGLTFFKDQKVHHLDLNTGALAWAVRGNFRGLAPVGDAGALVFRMPLGMDVLRRRAAPPEGARFFNANGTPLKFSLGEDLWSVPAGAGDLIYSLASSGTCYAIDLKKNEVAATIKVVGSATAPIQPPFLLKNRLAVSAAGATHVFDTGTRNRLFQVPDTAGRADRTPLIADGLLTLSGGLLQLSDGETGKRIWASQARGLRDFILSGKKASAISTQGLVRVDLNSGETDDTCASPPGVSLLAEDGKRLYAAVGPFLVGEARPGDDFRELYKSPQQDAKILFLFKGWLAATGGKVVFSHAGGEVTGIDPDVRNEDKRAVWSFPVPEFTSALLAHEGRVWFSAPGKGLFGLNAATGAEEWKLEVSDATLFAPFLFEGKPAFWSSEGWMIQPK